MITGLSPTIILWSRRKPIFSVLAIWDQQVTTRNIAMLLLSGSRKATLWGILEDWSWMSIKFSSRDMEYSVTVDQTNINANLEHSMRQLHLPSSLKKQEEWPSLLAKDQCLTMKFRATMTDCHSLWAAACRSDSSIISFDLYNVILTNILTIQFNYLGDLNNNYTYWSAWWKTTSRSTNLPALINRKSRS